MEAYGILQIDLKTPEINDIWFWYTQKQIIELTRMHFRHKYEWSLVFKISKQE